MFAVLLARLHRVSEATLTLSSGLSMALLTAVSTTPVSPTRNATVCPGCSGRADSNVARSSSIVGGELPSAEGSSTSKDSTGRRPLLVMVMRRNVFWPE